MNSTDDPHLLLYFDVNKTVIMHDPVQKKDFHHIINDIFAARARGTVSEDGLTWIWNGESLDDAPSQEEHVTYGDYLRHRYPVCSDPVLSNQNKRIRRQYRSHFTSPGYPGESMARQFEAVLNQLRLPSLPSSATVHVLEDIGLEQTPYYFIIPSFFRLIQWLHTRKTSFNLIFRTFGDDLHRIALEFNAFCEGRHPFFQLTDERMDGSNGSVDRRLHVESTRSTQNPHQHGTFIRSDTSTTLVMGTFEQPPPDTLMMDEMESFYHHVGSSPLVFIRGMNEIHEFLNATSWRQAQSTLAIRDFYPHWFRHEEAVEAGKLMTIDTSDSHTHVMFLDDNIFKESPHIVDCRHYPHGTSLSYQETRDIHLLRVEPYEAIVDCDYFIKRIEFSLGQRRASIVNIEQTE